MLVTELRRALRQLSRRPGFLLLGAGALGLGLAAAALVFMGVNMLMLRPLPGIHAERDLVEVGRLSRDGGFDTFSYPDFRDLREHVRALDKVWAWRMGPAYATTTGAPQRATALLVSGDYFPGLGTGAAYGRLLDADSDGAPGAAPVAVVSWAAFQRLFDGDPDKIGSTVELNGSRYTLIGVTERGFHGHIAALSPDFYVPLSMSTTMRIGHDSDFERRGSRSLMLGGRLAPGATLEQVNDELTALGTRLSAEFPEADREISFAAAPLRPLPQAAQTMVMLLSGVLFVLCAAILALACSNLAGVLLARGEARSGELAMRHVLGAGRGRIALQLFFEAALIALAAGVLALLLVTLGSGVLNLLPIPAPMPIDLSLAVDHRVLLFCFATTGIVAVGFGLLPALRVSRQAPVRDVQSNAVTAGSSRQLLRHGLLALQSALTVALLLTAALVLRALGAAGAIDTGFRVDDVYTADVDLSPLAIDSAEGSRILHELSRRLEAVPGVERASFASVVPLSMSRLGFGAARLPGSDQLLDLDVNTVGAGFFDVFGLDVRGRPITEADRGDGDKVAVINSTFAHRLFGDADALGREFELGWGENWDRLRIIGVVPDGRYSSMSDDASAFAFFPAPQWPRSEFALTVHSTLGAEALRRQIEQEMRLLLPQVPPPAVHPFADSAALSILPQKILGSAASALGTLALLLAATGLYGVLAFQVERRVRELGLRRALGAPAARIARTLLARTGSWLLVGALFGLALGQLAALALSEQLFGIGGADPLALSGVALAFVAMAALAMARPLSRALKLEPMVALRHD